MRYDYSPPEISSPSMKEEIGGYALSLLRGLANWIGIGDAITSGARQSDKYKGLQALKNQLSARINALLDQDQINVNELEDKLQQLRNAGIVLSGISLSRVGEKAREIEKQIRSTKDDMKHNKISLGQYQAELDSLDPDYTDLAEVARSYEKATKISNALGGTDNALQQENIQKTNQ